MATLHFSKIGNSVGTIWPKELLVQMHVAEGDDVFVTPAPGGFRVTPYDPETAEQLEVAERIMKEDRDVLRKLAE